ncbi:MAG: hypothetical protein HZB12_02840 [Candidatus Yonathbacteria bacterium]|nr:hypothetical protein [Candidatus Yonathbacteria bacterium]
MAVATGLLGVFLPIFLYNILDGNIPLVMAYYASACFVYLFLVAFGAQFLNRFGFRTALVIASLAAVVIYITYYFTTKENMAVLLPLSLVFLVIFRMLFWIPYHVDFAIFTNTGKRGGQVGLMLSTIALLGVVGPMIAGYVIEASSIQALFFVAIVAFTLGVIPFASVPRTNEKFSWNYVRAWRELFARENRAVVWASIAAGGEDTIGVVIWPIFIFILLNGDYFKVGALSSFIVGVTVLLQYMFGRYLDRLNSKTREKHRMLRAESILYAFGWVIKIFVVTAFHVFIAGLYHKITKVVTDTSYDAIFYEMAADQGHYVDEFTVLSEMALQIGKIIALGAVAILVMFISLNWTFVIGAIASLAFTALSLKYEGERRLV